MDAVNDGNNARGRRGFIKNVAAGVGIIPLSLPLAQERKEDLVKKKVVCVGGHPDDPESGCGGTLARLSNEGHAVTIIYLTTGEAGIDGKTHVEAAAIRKGEAVNACKLLKAKPVFAGQTDGDTIVNKDWIKKLHGLIELEKPDIVFTHWPVDSHKDHQAASLLTIQAWMNSGKAFQLFFFEVLTGIQSAGFNPTDYVDITATQEQKRKAVFCHKSQHPETIYSEGHSAMEDFRGKEIGSKAAEAFVKVSGKTASAII